MTETLIISTCDTNIVVYHYALDNPKAEAATAALRSCSFLSVQVLNEYTNVARRKQNLPWSEISDDVADLISGIGVVRSIEVADNRHARRIANRYQLSFYDSLMLAVALSGGARTIYSEDLQHGLVIDDTLRIVDPFR